MRITSFMKLVIIASIHLKNNFLRPHVVEIIIPALVVSNCLFERSTKITYAEIACEIGRMS